MASEQLIKEELQNGSGASASSTSSHMDDDESTGTLERAAQLGVMNGVKGKTEAGHEEQGTGSEDAEGEDEDMEEEVEDDDEEDEDDEDDEDADGDFENGDGDDYESEAAAEDDEEDLDEDDTILPSAPPKRRLRTKHQDGDEDSAEYEDEDEEGDEENGGSDADAVADGEGVGAVKIRPGETDDDDDSDASAVPSESSDDEWEENPENADEADDDEGDDEDSEHSICLYCQQGDEDISGKATDTFYMCDGCGKAAHRSCAIEDKNPAQKDGLWKCNNCNDDKQSAAIAGDAMDIDGTVQQTTTGCIDGMSPSRSTLRANTPKSSLALRSAATHADRASEDHTDTGSRPLRKRRTSPVESGDSGMSLRKRRKNVTDDLSIDGFSDIRDTATPSSARSLRIKPAATSSQVMIIKKTRSSLIIKMKVSPAELRRITVKKRKYTRRGTANKVSKKDKARQEEVGGMRSGDGGALPLLPTGNVHAQPFYAFFDKETEEQKSKPYGGILTEAEADTSKTFPTADDRRRFDEAKQRAEEQWRARLLAMQQQQQRPEAETQPAKRKKSSSGPASQIECIEFGGWEIDTWYAAPYPEEYSRNRVLYICEFCLKYMNSDYVAWRHKLKCPAKHPPGDEIYRCGSISFFEVDGRKNPVYCQNLCLLAKLFLGSKTLYYDVEPFLFYVLCEYDEFGYHFVGYFSKEKRASSQNNVSCILTLPIHQRKGYGNLLIDFSYLLTRVEKKTGSPEKPLSDMGLVSYRNYWRLVLCRYLLDAMAAAAAPDATLGLSIKTMSDDTGMTPDDVISALEGLRCLVRDPQTGLYAFRVDRTYCQEYVAKWEAKKYVTLDPAMLTWTPYVMGRGNATNFELGPALTAIAPREEDDDDVEHKAAEEHLTSLGKSSSAGGSLPNGCSGAALAEDAAAASTEATATTTAMAATVAATGSTNGNPDVQVILASTEPDENRGDAAAQLEDGMATKTGLPPSQQEDGQPEVNGDEQAKADSMNASVNTAANGGSVLQVVSGNAGGATTTAAAAAAAADEMQREDDGGDTVQDVKGGTNEHTRTENETTATAVSASVSADTMDVDANMDNDAVEHRGDSETRAPGRPDNRNDWVAAYDGVPPTRFVVFPPVSARRPNYARAPVGRPPGARNGSGSRVRRRASTGTSMGEVRRAVAARSASRPKAPSSSRKKSGGTGRGPGRWPKGTKKSDYGNAESGPGLPPAWLAARIAAESRKAGSRGSRAATAEMHEEHGGSAVATVEADENGDAPEEPTEEVEAEVEGEGGGGGSDDNGHGGSSGGDLEDEAEEDADGEDEDMTAPTATRVASGDGDTSADDTVQVRTPTSSRLVDKRNNMNGAALESGSRSRSSPRLGKLKAMQEGGDDSVMVDAEG